MFRSEQSMVEPRAQRRHPQRGANAFDLAVGKVKIEQETDRTSDRGRSFELFVAPRSVRKHAGRPEVKAA